MSPKPLSLSLFSTFLTLDILLYTVYNNDRHAVSKGKGLWSIDNNSNQIFPRKGINTPRTVYILTHNLILPNTNTTHPSTQRKPPTIILNRSINRSSRREEKRKHKQNKKEQLILFFFFRSSPTLATSTQQPLLSQFYQSIRPRYPLSQSESHSQKSPKRADFSNYISLYTFPPQKSTRR